MCGHSSFHYWILSGALIAVPIYGPGYGAKALKGTLRSTDEYIWPLVGLWLVRPLPPSLPFPPTKLKEARQFGEVSNLVTHLNLRSLRPPGTRTRAIPQGYGFSLVACPNYLFEAVAWTAFALLTLSPASFLFLAVSAGQMAIWAKKKQRNYKKEFGTKWPRHRTAMVPLVF